MNKINAFNIFLTNNCNKDCPFCFVKEKKGTSELDINDFREIVIPVLKRNNIGHITLIGGEPTIYKDLPRIIQALNCNRISYEIFSNGLFDKGIFNNIDLRNIPVSVHLPNDVNEERKIIDNMVFLNKKKAEVKLRDVITENYNFNKAIKFIQRERSLIRGVRFKISQPDVNNTNDYVTDVTRIKKSLLLFLKTVNKLNIHISNCCFLPFCAFSDEELSFLREINYLSNCKRVFYIDTDLSIRMCPFHNDIFSTINNLGDVIKKKSRIKVPMYKKCVNCKYYISDECIPCFSACRINLMDSIKICGLERVRGLNE